MEFVSTRWTTFVLLSIAQSWFQCLRNSLRNCNILILNQIKFNSKLRKPLRWEWDLKDSQGWIFTLLSFEIWHFVDWYAYWYFRGTCWLCHKSRQDGQFMYNVTWRHFRVTTVAVEKQHVLHIPVCVLYIT